MSVHGCLKFKITYCFSVCLNFEMTTLKDLWAKVAAVRWKGVVLSKMFVLRSIGNELVPSPL